CFTQCYKLFCCHRHIIVFRIRPEKRLRHVDVIVKSASNDGLTILRAVDKESAQEFVQETLQEVWETADDWFIR
ncbi:DinI family protein, partial [Escherichia coli]|uniref:DinI-like family protein n=2 Tax=Escherichia coli TaxID=562 RepID=UPI00202F2E66